MATSAALLYTTAAGELRGTAIGHMGGHVPEQLTARFGSDYTKLTEFIEQGRERGGYRYPTDVAPNWDADEDNWAFNVAAADDNDYVWHVLPTGEFQSVSLVPSYTLVVNG